MFFFDIWKEEKLLSIWNWKKQSSLSFIFIIVCSLSISEIKFCENTFYSLMLKISIISQLFHNKYFKNQFIYSILYMSDSDYFESYIFWNSYESLVKLKYNAMHGLILNKPFCWNVSLRELAISWHDINDLCVLFYGLTPNFNFLDVTVCDSTLYNEILIEECLPHFKQFDCSIRTTNNLDMKVNW